MMRRGAGFYPNEARRQLLKEGQDVATLQLAANEHVAFRVDAVHLKHRLHYVETDGCNRLHDWLLRIVGALTASHSHGNDVPVDGAVNSITSGHNAGRAVCTCIILAGQWNDPVSCML
jgi:hypothetical protein